MSCFSAVYEYLAYFHKENVDQKVFKVSTKNIFELVFWKSSKRLFNLRYDYLSYSKNIKFDILHKPLRYIH